MMGNRYDKYKDSGIAWIGEIPEHWEVRTLKTMLSGLQDGTHGTFENIISNYLLLSAKNITDNGLQFSDLERTISENDYKAIVSNGYPQKGDILLCCVGTIGRCCIYNYDKIYAFQRSVSFLRTNKNESNSFLLYLLRSQICTTQFLMLARTSAQSGIYLSTLANLIIVTPSLFEQQSIAAYLDQKCGEIDELITLQEEMITKLQSYKQSVITEAVTKGLDKNVLLKDSGIKWIGEIPKHWEASKTLFVLSMSITDGPHTTPELFETGIPFVSAEAVSFGNGRIDFSHIRGYISEIFYQECCKKYIPQIDDIYMIKSGATTGRVAIVDADIKFTIWSPLAVFRCNKERMLPRFLFYQLQSNGYQKQIELNWSYGTQQNIGMRTLEKLILSVPPLPEQYSIADYLDKKCSEIDELISIKQQKIEKLKEYKKSLIFECVTGKRKVS